MAPKIVCLGDECDPDDKLDRFDIIIYDYSSGSYEGSGEALARIAETRLWYSHDMGHCSCNGPWDTFGDNAEGETIKHLIGRCTPEALKNASSVIKEALKYCHEDEYYEL